MFIRYIGVGSVFLGFVVSVVDKGFYCGFVCLVWSFFYVCL